MQLTLEQPERPAEETRFRTEKPKAVACSDWLESLPEPFYKDASVAIYHAKAEILLPMLAPVNLVLTDVPYGEVNRETNGLRNLDKGEADTTSMTPEEIAAMLLPKTTGSIYVWCGTEQVSGLRRAMVDAGMSTRACVWEKSNPSPMNGQYLWLSAVELCAYGKLPTATFNEMCVSPVFRGPVAESNGHPTPKPEWLMQKLILASTNPGDTILDPFCGSGTTLRAAKDLGRRAIGIEANETYCRLAARRMAQEVLAL